MTRTFWLIAAAVFGACIGSFLNVVIYRLPLGQSLVTPPSRCPQCGYRLKWYDNIPILGWLLLGGRCRECRNRISIQYPIVELTTAVLFVLVVWATPPGALLVSRLLLLCILIALFGKLPVALTLMTGVVGMLLAGVLKMDEAYAAINWKTVFLTAGLIPLGWAMDSSGAAAWVAGHTLDKLPDGTPPWALQIVVALLTTGFSLVISHVGATIVMVPIAINLALAVGGDPTAFALIAALSASNNLMTASNPVMSMITGPANYSARDLWRVGGPLALVYTVVAVGVVNLMFWGGR